MGKFSRLQIDVCLFFYIIFFFFFFLVQKIGFDISCKLSPQSVPPDQGSVAQSIVSLTSSLVVKMLTVLVSTTSNSQVFC